LIAQALEFGPGGTELRLELGRGLGHGLGRRVELFDPEVERAARDPQIAGDGRSGTLAVEVHLDGGLFKLFIITMTFFS